MECPLCRCEKFYLKDPDDPFETYEFTWRDGEILFECDESLKVMIKNRIRRFYCPTSLVSNSKEPMVTVPKQKNVSTAKSTTIGNVEAATSPRRIPSMP